MIYRLNSPASEMQSPSLTTENNNMEQCRQYISGWPLMKHAKHKSFSIFANHIENKFSLTGENIVNQLLMYNSRCEVPLSELDIRSICEGVSNKGHGNCHELKLLLNKNRTDYKEAEYDPFLGRFRFEPSRPLPIAKIFVDENYLLNSHLTLRYRKGLLFQWVENVYAIIDDEDVCGKIQSFLTTEAATMNGKDFPANGKNTTEVLASLRQYVQIPSDIPENSWVGSGDPPCSPDHLIFGKTKIYDWKTDRFLPSDPRWFNLSKLSVDVMSDPPNPQRYLSFLKDIFGDDLESVSLLHEYFGLLLIACTKYQKLLLIIGPSRSGKGALGRLITSLLGKNNVCFPQTSMLSSRFGMQSLIGKTLAIISDARFSGKDIQSSIERILNVTGEDTITIDRKNRDPVSCRLGTRIIILSNESPRLPDASSAIINRILAIRLKNSFLGREDLDLENALISELPGILKCSIEGLRRLDQRGYFLQPDSGKEIISEMKGIGSPVFAFVDEKLQIGEGLRIGAAELYELYIEWCSDNEIRFQGNPMFGKDLKAAFPEIQKREGTKKVDGTKYYFYEGIGLPQHLEIPKMSELNNEQTPLNFSYLDETRM